MRENKEMEEACVAEAVLEHQLAVFPGLLLPGCATA